MSNLKVHRSTSASDAPDLGIRISWTEHVDVEDVLADGGRREDQGCRCAGSCLGMISILLFSRPLARWI